MLISSFAPRLYRYYAETSSTVSCDTLEFSFDCFLMRSHNGSDRQFTKTLSSYRKMYVANWKI